MQRLYTVKQAARYFGVSTRTVMRWIGSGELESILLGERGRRVSEAHIEAFLATRRVPQLNQLERAA